jgi:hypothetical protein
MVNTCDDELQQDKLVLWYLTIEDHNRLTQNSIKYKFQIELKLHLKLVAIVINLM